MKYDIYKSISFMNKKINESTTSSSDGQFKGKLNITPQNWSNNQLQPYIDKVSDYVNNDTSYDSYDGNIKKTKKEIQKDEVITKSKVNKVKKMRKKIFKDDILKEDLAVWFGTKKKPKGSKQPKGPWVNICRKKEGGGHPPCGRPEGESKGYPKCRAAGVASKMTDAQKKAACAQKRREEKKNPKAGKGNKPTMVSYKNKKNESLRDLITKVLRESSSKNQ
jgi:hypothetical protein